VRGVRSYHARRTGPMLRRQAHKRHAAARSASRRGVTTIRTLFPCPPIRFLGSLSSSTLVRFDGPYGFLPDLTICRSDTVPDLGSNGIVAHRAYPVKSDFWTRPRRSRHSRPHERFELIELRLRSAFAYTRRACPPEAQRTRATSPTRPRVLYTTLYAASTRADRVGDPGREASTGSCGRAPVDPP
jgi:hypothetical protein